MLREEFKVTAGDLLNSKVPGTITKEGVKSNVSAALAYSSGWISGNGCIPLNYLMEDAATAEIARIQLWQWAHYGSKLDTGEPISPELIDEILAEVSPTIVKLVPSAKDEHVQICCEYLKKQVRQQWASEFLTSDLMPYLEYVDGVQSQWKRSVL